MRQRPTAALLELDDPYTGWVPDDYKLQEAVITMNNEKCSSCGNPVWLCHSASNQIEFEIRKGACYGKAEVDDIKKTHPELDEPGPGEYYYAVAVGIDDGEGGHEPLPRRREAMAVIADS